MRRWTARAAVLTATGALILTTSGCKTIPAETHRTNGDRSFQFGAYEEAADDYRAITQRYPGDWPAQYQLGLCELQLGNFGEARRALAIALERQPDNEDIVAALSEAMYGAGDTDQLFAFLRDRANLNQTPESWLRVGHYALKLSDPDLARVAIDTAIAIGIDPTGDSSAVPPSPEPYLAAANLAEELGDRDELRRRLRQAYGLAPTDERILERLRAMGEVPGPSLALPPGR